MADIGSVAVTVTPHVPAFSSGPTIGVAAVTVTPHVPSFSSGPTIETVAVEATAQPIIIKTGPIIGRASIFVSAQPVFFALPTTAAPEFPGEYPQGKVVVLNANTLAVSEYSIAALDVVEHEGELYFVTATGLTKLDPAGDLASTSYIKTGDLNLNPGYRINLWRVSADLSADAPTRLTTQLHIAGQERDIAYTVPERSSTQSRSRVIELGRGPRAEEWSVKFGTTETGGNWALTSMKVYPGAMKQGR